jgi:hypothetical protein
VRKTYKILVGKSIGKRPLVKARSRWDDDIKVDLTKLGLGGMDWIHLAQDGDR